MSRETINSILGLATVDEEFCQALLANPLAAAQARHFELTGDERELLKAISATTLTEFSQQLVALLDENKEK